MTNIRFSVSKILGGIILLIVLSVGIYVSIPYHFQKEQKQSTVDILGNVLIGSKSIEYTTIEDVPLQLVDIIITTEDKRFRNHYGIDIKALLRAVLNNIQGKPIQGGSTLHQQLIKIDQGNYSRTYPRKVYELFGAIKLGIHMSREDIFLKYINSIERKNNITGRRAACNVYRDKECKELSTSELFVLLAAAQRGYNPLNDSQHVDILDRAQWLCSIHQDLCDQIDSFVFDDLAYTIDALDPRIQQIVKEQENTVYNTSLADDIDRVLYNTRLLRTQYNVHDCCIIVLDDDGGLVSMNMCTERNDERGKTSACMLPRQTGSAIKPFLYTYAMNILGYVKEDTIIDEYVAYDLDGGAVYEPKNFDLRYHGEVSLAYALGNSLNIPAVKLLERVGVNGFLEFLQEQLTTYAPKFPLSTSKVQDLGLSLALGTYEISPYQFALLRQFFLSKNRSNNYAFYQEQVTTILSNAQNKVDGFGQDNYIHQSGRAIKTGTSRKFIDAWICGTQIKKVDAYIACIWMGNISNQAMHGSSSEVAGYIWSRVVGLIEKL